MAPPLESEIQKRKNHTPQEGLGSHPNNLGSEFPAITSGAFDGEGSKDEGPLSNASIDQEFNVLSPIYLVAKRCLERYKELRSVLGSSEADKDEQLGPDLDSARLIIEDAQARFKAWGSNIAAFRNGTLRTSLDFRLAEAPGLKRRTTKVLEDLEEYLDETILIVSGQKKNEIWNLDDTSDFSDYSEEEENHHNSNERIPEEEIKGSNLDELLKAIPAANASLMKLSIVIRSSATRDDYLKAASRYKTWNPYPDIGHVREKHGAAKHTSDWLLERLGKAITRRRQFLKYRIEHNDRLAGLWDEDEVRREKPEKTIASTKATTFMGENIPQNIRAPGSDAGNSFGSQTSYEPTIYEGKDAPRKLTMPPPPKNAFPDVRFEYGEPFKCPYCFTEHIVKNKGAWKKHVFQDLKPYVCTFSGCDMLMFRSRNEWFAHELQNHRREWACQFCQQPPFATVSAFSKHTKSAHPSVVAGSSLEALVLQSEEPVDKISSSACPLCDDWEADLNRKQINLEARRPSLGGLNTNIYGKPKLFRRHLGRHMEQLALFALPSNDTQELEDESTDDSLRNRYGVTYSEPSSPTESSNVGRVWPGMHQHQQQNAIQQQKQEAEVSNLDPVTAAYRAGKIDADQEYIANSHSAPPLPELSSSQPVDPETGFSNNDTEVDLDTRLGRGRAPLHPASHLETHESAKPVYDQYGSTSRSTDRRPQTPEAKPQKVYIERDRYEREHIVIRKQRRQSTTPLRPSTALVEEEEVERELKQTREELKTWRNIEAAEAKEGEEAKEREDEYKLRLADDLRKAGMDARQLPADFLEETEEIRRKKDEQEAIERRKIKEAARVTQVQREKEEREKEYQKRLEEDLRKAGLDERQINAVTKKDKQIDSNRPTLTRMSRRHLSIETLNTYRIDYEFDEDPNYVLIRRWVPEYEQDFLWNHTHEIRERRQRALVANKGKEKPGDAEFEFVRKKENKRKVSPSPLLTFLAGGKRSSNPGEASDGRS